VHGLWTGDPMKAAIEGTTPCNCPYTGRRDAEPEAGAVSRAKRQRCRTAVAGCTVAGPPGAPKGNSNAREHGRYTAEADSEAPRDCGAVARHDMVCRHNACGSTQSGTQAQRARDICAVFCAVIRNLL
jgi:hypothetical protein